MNLKEVVNHEWFCDACDDTVTVNVIMSGTGGECVQYNVVCKECGAELDHQLCEQIELVVPEISDKQYILNRVINNFGHIDNIYVKRIINLIKRTGGK